VHNTDTYKNGSGKDMMTDMIDADGENKNNDEYDGGCMDDGCKRWVNGT